MKFLAALATVCLFLPISLSAAVTVITLDMTTQTAGGAGEAFDTGANFESNDVTFSVSATSNFGDMTAVFNATASNGGVNTDGASASGGDTASEIDAGETLTLLMELGVSVTEVRITEVNFAGITGATDSFQVQYPDGLGGSTTEVLDDASATVSAGDDVWTPTAPIVFADGDSITFSNVSAGAYRLQDISLEIVTIPEPASVALLAGAWVSVICLRRRA